MAHLAPFFRYGLSRQEYGVLFTRKEGEMPLDIREEDKGLSEKECNRVISEILFTRQTCEFVKRKMQEDGFLRRILPPMDDARANTNDGS